MNLFADGAHEHTHGLGLVNNYFLEGLIRQSDAERTMLFLEHELFLQYFINIYILIVSYIILTPGAIS